MLWHCGSHMLAKLLCALGVSAPPGIEAYVCGPGALVYEGLLMPVCKLVSGVCGVRGVVRCMSKWTAVLKELLRRVPVRTNSG